MSRSLLEDGVKSSRIDPLLLPYSKQTETGGRSAFRDHRDSVDGSISSATIMAELPVDFRLADTAAPTTVLKTSVP